MEYIEHISKDGERWDQISYEYYGDSTLYEQIIKANPYIPITPILSSGLTIRIPILEDTTDTTTITPPWES